jgi:hypothetical protein
LSYSQPSLSGQEIHFYPPKKCENIVDENDQYCDRETRILNERMARIERQQLPEKYKLNFDVSSAGPYRREVTN